MISYYTVIDSVDDHYSLHCNLTSLENWSDIWQMKFNPAKCVHLAITNKRTYIKNCYQTHTVNTTYKPISQVSRYHY